MRHPRIATVRVVLHEEEASSRLEKAHDMPNDGHVIAMEVQGVRHDDPVERWQLERTCEVCPVDLQDDLGELLLHRTLLHSKRTRVRVHRMDLAAGPEELRERERKCALA